MKRQSDKKLYVWRDVFSDYSGGMAFAVATSVDEARRMIAAAKVQWLWNPNKDNHSAERILSSEYAVVTDEQLEPHMDSVQAELCEEPEIYDLDDQVAFMIYGGG